MVESLSYRTRFPTLTQQLFQLAAGTTTSDELVRRSLDAITATQPTLNAFRVVLTEQALADAAEADRKRAAGNRTSTAWHPDRGQGRRRRRGGPDPVRRRRKHPPGAGGFRGGAATAGGRCGDRRQDQHLRVGSMAVHQRPGVRPHPQPVVARAHAGRLVGGQRRGGGGRAGRGRDRFRRRGQRADPRGVDASGRHQTAAGPDLHLAAARGVQRDHRQRRAGPNGHRRRAGARRGVRQCRR